MLRPYVTINELQLLSLERPIPSLIATRVFAPFPYRDKSSRDFFHEAKSSRSTKQGHDGNSPAHKSWSTIPIPAKSTSLSPHNISHNIPEFAKFKFRTEQRRLHTISPSHQQNVPSLLSHHNEGQSHPFRDGMSHPIKASSQAPQEVSGEGVQRTSATESTRLRTLQLETLPIITNIVDGFAPKEHAGNTTEKPVSCAKSLQSPPYQDLIQNVTNRRPEAVSPVHIKFVRAAEDRTSFWPKRVGKRGLPWDQIAVQKRGRQGRLQESMPRYVGLRPQESNCGRLDRFSRRWSTHIAFLLAKLEGRAPEIHDYERYVRWPIWVEEKARQFNQYLKNAPGGTEEFWRRLPSLFIKRNWAYMMLWHLDKSAEASLLFFQSSLSFHKPEAHQVVDVFDIVTRLFEKERVERTTASLRTWPALEQAMTLYTRAPEFTQHTIRRVLRGLPKLDLAVAFHRLQSLGVPLHHNTSLQISNFLASSGDIEGALVALTIALHSGSNVGDEAVLKTSAKIIRKAREPNGKYDRITDSVAELLKLGIHLNLTMYNILILNAAEAGDSATAWRIWDMIRANGVQPNHITYNILMSMCRRTGSKDGFQYLYSQLNPEAQETLHDSLVSEIIVCRYVFGSADNFEHVLEFYEKHCDLQPLKNFGILPQHYRSRFEGWYSSARTQPNTATLGTMIHIYLRVCTYTRGSKFAAAIMVYNRFQVEIGKGNPAALALATTDHIYNAFLKAFSTINAFTTKATEAPRSRHHGIDNRSSIFWADVLRAMRKPFVHAVPHPETGKVMEPARPTRQTWNIILNAFARRGEEGEAERILELMERYGFKPDVVSWNSMLSGFSRFQQNDLVAAILSRMKEADVESDKHTAKALEHLQDYQPVIKAAHEIASGRRVRSLRFVASPPSIHNRTHAVRPHLVSALLPYPRRAARRNKGIRSPLNPRKRGLSLRRPTGSSYIAPSWRTDHIGMQ